MMFYVILYTSNGQGYINAEGVGCVEVEDDDAAVARPVSLPFAEDEKDSKNGIVGLRIIPIRSGGPVIREKGFSVIIRRYVPLGSTVSNHPLRKNPQSAIRNCDAVLRSSSFLSSSPSFPFWSRFFCLR